MFTPGVDVIQDRIEAWSFYLEPVGAGDQDDASGRAIIRRRVLISSSCKPRSSEAPRCPFMIEDAQHQIFAVRGGLRRHENRMERPGQAGRNAPVLRCARLGDKIHAADHSQAHHHRRPVVLVKRTDLLQHAVDAVADAQNPARLEVDVQAPRLTASLSKCVDQAHHRLAVFVRIDRERLVVDFAGLDLFRIPSIESSKP